MKKYCISVLFAILFVSCGPSAKQKELMYGDSIQKVYAAKEKRDKPEELKREAVRLKSAKYNGLSIFNYDYKYNADQKRTDFLTLRNNYNKTIISFKIELRCVDRSSSGCHEVKVKKIKINPNSKIDIVIKEWEEFKEWYNRNCCVNSYKTIIISIGQVIFEDGSFNTNGLPDYTSISPDEVESSLGELDKIPDNYMFQSKTYIENTIYLPFP